MCMKSLLELSESGFSSLLKTGSMILLIIFKWHPFKDRNISMEGLKRPLRAFIKKKKKINLTFLRYTVLCNSVGALLLHSPSRWSLSASVIWKGGLWGGQSVFHCVFFCPGVFSLHWQCVWDHCYYWKIRLFINQMFSRWYCIVASNLLIIFFVHNSISFDMISITAGWIVASNHNRASTMFYRLL